MEIQSKCPTCGKPVTSTTTWRTKKQGVWCVPTCRDCYLEDKAKVFWEVYCDRTTKSDKWETLPQWQRFGIIAGLEAII